MAVEVVPAKGGEKPRHVVAEVQIEAAGSDPALSLEEKAFRKEGAKCGGMVVISRYYHNAAFFSRRQYRYKLSDRTDIPGELPGCYFEFHIVGQVPGVNDPEGIEKADKPGEGRVEGERGVGDVKDYLSLQPSKLLGDVYAEQDAVEGTPPVFFHEHIASVKLYHDPSSFFPSVIRARMGKNDRRSFMNPLIVRRVSQELKLPGPSVEAVLSLLGEGSTVPFIARYRKEATGSLDEESILAISERYGRLEDLEARRKAICSSLAERGLLTGELEQRLLSASSLAVLEDIYLPFRPKRKTRASAAVLKGLAPLADLLFAQEEGVPALLARPFLSEETEVSSVEDALQGARDILAERFSEDGEARRLMRHLFGRRGRIRSSLARGKEEEGANFRDYFDREEPAAAAPSHRVLAMFRGEKEKVLVLSFLPPEKEALEILRPLFVKGTGPSSLHVEQALGDGYRRLLAPSMETELRNALKKRADREAISVFARNIREMLLAPPLGPKNILALDPGFRTGCKFVCLNRQGDLLHSGVIYPHPPRKDEEGSASVIRKALADYSIEAVAIGNGTAGRETERFFKKLDLSPSLIVTLVNESGASVYSASEVARREFPDQDITVRGAVSIGRRLLDPLSELVKIDPKAIGVGQYQHDVDQKDLKKTLSAVVESCVHAVGVNVNTASTELLSFVSGIGPAMADQIVRTREEKGPFPDRKALLSVPRLGAKTFEQAAGFLRIPEGSSPLDGSAVHPERYSLVERMAADLGCAVEDLMKNRELREKISPEKYLSPDTGMPTLQDILAELEKPGRDPRSTFELFFYAEGVETMEDLRAGMELPGVVTNITAFGAFVDLGVHQDGLVHRNHMSPAERSGLKPGQQVKVSVLEVDLGRKRISLSMKTGPKGNKS